MSRRTLQEKLGMLSVIQERRENKALWDHITSHEKGSIDKAAEDKRAHEHFLQELAALAQQLKELQENAVTKQEFEAYKEREKAWREMDAFYSTGAMGEQKKAAADQRIATRAENHHAMNESPIVLDRLEEIDTQPLPPLPSYKSPFFRSELDENRAQGTVAELSLEELRAMAGEASARSSDDEADNNDNENEDNYDDDGFNDFWVKKGGQSKQVPRNLAHGEGNARSREREGQGVGSARSGEGEEHGEGHEDRARNGVGADVDKRTMATVFAKPAVCYQPPKFPNNNRFDAGITSHHFLNESQQKRPHDAMSNVSMRVDEHMAEQERKKANNPPFAKRPRVSDYTPPELLYGHRPQTRSTVPEKSIQPPPAPHKPPPKPDLNIMKPKIKPIPAHVVDKTIPNPIVNPDPKLKLKLKLPRLKQGKGASMAMYHKEADEAFSTFPHKDENGQEEFVNHFLAGIFAKNTRNEAIAMLQQNEDSTVKYKRPWIQCQWKNVAKSLLAARLVTKQDLA